MIASAMQNGAITLQYADLLRKIQSSTFGAELADLQKVQTVLSMQDELGLANLGTGRVVYVASGIDWEFPVALGARDIDMVDLSFEKTRSGNAKRDLLKSVREADPKATVSKNGDISFGIDLGGEGCENIDLHMIALDADSYTPTVPVQGVIEYNAPHSTNKELVRGNILPSLSPGASVFNFDFYEDYSPDGAVKKPMSQSTHYYKVEDPDRFKASLDAKPRLEEPNYNVKEIRAKLRDLKRADGET